MGGITFIVYTNQNVGMNFLKSFMKLKHRGADNTCFVTESTQDIVNANVVLNQRVTSILSKSQLAAYQQHSFVYGYHHLANLDASHDAMQPFNDPIVHKMSKYPELRMRPARKMLCDGAVYNYLHLAPEFTDRDVQSESDLEIILPLYIRNGGGEVGLTTTLDQLDAAFSLVITENVNTFVLNEINTFVARDHFGIKPLYYITDNRSLWMFVSELKGIPQFIIANKQYMIRELDPGSYWSFQTKSITNYYTPEYTLDINNTDPETINEIFTTLKDLLIKSVERRCHSELPVGILLSGGFDSSIISSIVAHNLSEDSELHLFTVGDSLGSETLLDNHYAERCVQFLEKKFPKLKISFHDIHINEMDVLIADLKDIIYTIETDDLKLIRKAIPMYFLSRYIREHTDVRVLLTGDGLDELYNENVITALRSKIFSIVDKIGSKFNLEMRFPYLNREFVEYHLRLSNLLKSPQIFDNTKRPIEKYLVRKAFDLGIEYLPREILWRSSKCVSHALTNFELRLQNHFEDFMSDQEFNMELNKLIFTTGSVTPKTKEELVYKNLFEQLFGKRLYV